MEQQSLARLTTLRVGGPARAVVSAASEAELIDAVASVDLAGHPLLVLGGGSNVVVADEGFDGTVVHVAGRGLEVLAADACGGVLVRVQAGEPWDAFVEHAVEQGWAGVETLAGIPGLAGATPLQNVGAYGRDVASTIARVRTYDRAAREVRTFVNEQCRFAYRSSRFSRSDRFVVLEVTFQLRPGRLSEPVTYDELAHALGVAPAGRAPLPAVREAVLELRARKGMVLDPGDHDTWSTGSFFTNPVVEPGRVPVGAPAWPQPDGRVKTSAAWLIEHAGFVRGYPGAGSAVRVSTKHTLALTNRGNGTARELVALAREIRDEVSRRFGVTLEPEPRLVGVSLGGVPAG